MWVGVVGGTVGVECLCDFSDGVCGGVGVVVTHESRCIGMYGCGLGYDVEVCFASGEGYVGVHIGF